MRTQSERPVNDTRVTRLLYLFDQFVSCVTPDIGSRSSQEILQRECAGPSTDNSQIVPVIHDQKIQDCVIGKQD